MKTNLLIALLLMASVFTRQDAFAQTGTASEFIMFSPLQENTTYLLDTAGNIYHQWNCSATPACTAYLLKDGSIMRPYRVSNPTMTSGGVGGGIQIIDWNGNVTWDYTWSSANHQQHHEVIPIDKGGGNYNALLISWERKTSSEATQAGRQNANSEMWPTEIIEIEPSGANGGNVLWEWHLWDHLCQDVDPAKDNYYTNCDSHPELIDINLGLLSPGGGDWIHANALDYSPELDQIIFSSHELDEFYVIDRSTSTAEAATHSGGNGGIGGDILYRWGNRQNYGAGTSSDQELFVCHGANFIDSGLPGAGNIMIFNNGDRSGSLNDYSSVEEITAPINGYSYTLPWNQTPVWTYSDQQNFYSNHLSGAYRMQNGNTLATEGTSAHIIEVTPSGQIVFDYSVSGFNPQLAKAVSYPPDYTGLIGVVSNSDIMVDNNALRIYPNPAKDIFIIEMNPSTGSGCTINILDMCGHIVKKIENINDSKTSVERGDLSSGIYVVEVRSATQVMRRKILLK